MKNAPRDTLCKLLGEEVDPTPREFGRDELNLVEFPIAVLGDRAPKGCSVLTFQDRIWDKSHRQQVTRTLRIDGSQRLGLPTALDEEVLLGLIQLTKAAGFRSQTVEFSRYQLIDILGWRQEGKSYARLKTSLRRWVGVSFHYDNAWWDREKNCWMNHDFVLIGDLTLPEKPVGTRRTTDSPSSSFTWNATVFRSFRAGYMKQLDMNFYRRLNSSVAKRLYRFLDKRFYRKRRLEFDLKVFGYEHMGLSRSYDVGQLKRRLDPAIRELVSRHFLVMASGEERYEKVGPGRWIVRFVHSAKTNPTRRHSSRTRSRRLQRLHHPGREAKVTARSRIRRTETIADGKEILGQERIKDYLAALSKGQREAIEQEAFEAANPFLLERYRDCVKGRNETAQREYHQIIIGSYVHSLFGGK